MSLVKIIAPGYQRFVSREALARASPLFTFTKDEIDATNSGLSIKVLDALLNLIEAKPLPKLSPEDFVNLIGALKSFQMDRPPYQLTDFREYVTEFKQFEFSDFIFKLLGLGFDPKLNKGDLRYIPIYDQFEQFILDLSKRTLLDYSYFSTVPESRYSSLMPWHLPTVERAFKEELTNPRRIIDMTGHIGVDSIFFGVLYPEVFTISFENDPKVFLRLRDNLVRYAIILDRQDYLSSVYEGDRLVSAYLDDSTKHLDSPIVTSSDLVYLDPPWGGPEYYKQDSLDLYLSGTNVIEIIRKLLANGTPLVTLKAPANFNRSGLDQLRQVGDRQIKIKEKRIYTKPTGGKLSYLLFFLS